MSKALSNEQQRVIDAAQIYKAKAEDFWFSRLKPYCNHLAQSDQTFIVTLCLEHKCGVEFASLASNLWMLESAKLNDVEFVDFEAKLISSARAFFVAARMTFFDLQKHFKESPTAIYERMPDASNQLRGIIEFLDNELGDAHELRQIRANRLKPVKIPLGFQAISQAQKMFMVARAATAQQVLSGKQPLGTVTLHAASHVAPIPTETLAIAPVNNARETLTKEKSLERDRQRYEKTGKVTNPLLQEMWGKSRSTVSYRLKVLWNDDKISTSIASKLTASDVKIVINHWN